MADDLTTTWRHLIARLQRDDAAARQEVLARAYDRLRRLTGHLFHRQFPDLAGRHELDSAVNELWIRLSQALESQAPATPADFFRLAAHKIRQVLLDMVERQRRWDAREAQLRSDDTSLGGPQDPADRTHDPAGLSLWTEFHRKVAELPDDQRTVFEMHYYLDMAQADTAEALGLHPRKVSRLWVAATEHLADVLPALTGPSAT